MGKYDVVIVGGGPGGLKCAETLGGSDKRVLLLEKNDMIGPKVCAAGLTRKAFGFLGSPEEIVEKKFDNIVFVSPWQRTKLQFGEDFVYTTDREKLGQWQLKRVREFKNVEVRTGAKVEKIFYDHLELGGGEKIQFDKLVGADGAASRVRHFLKLRSDLMGVAFHYLLPPEKCPQFTEDMEIFFDAKLFSAWYCWVFPHRDYVSVGFGCFPRVMKFSQARENFEHWLKEKGVDVSSEKLNAFPINCDYRGFSFGGRKFFLVGEAAGLASGFTGEGIYQALASGDDVAKMILDESCEPKKIKEVIRERNVHHWMLRIVLFSFFFKRYIFEFVVFSTKSKSVARFLLRILT